eukprot:1496770-Rhodomonas_salina.1
MHPLKRVTVSRASHAQCNTPCRHPCDIYGAEQACISTAFQPHFNSISTLRNACGFEQQLKEARVLRKEQVTLAALMGTFL